ncbi:hypothetical protein BH23ACT5_BH23ACT5_09900 [soil metagenome]
MNAHNCGTQHRTYRTLAKCIWKTAHWVDGEGHLALVSYCPSGPYEQAITVTLWTDHESAERQKVMIDRTDCGGRCRGQHEINDLRQAR